METKDQATVYSNGDTEPTYLDVQAAVGISKHMGGYGATDALHQLCHVAEAQEVLDVGCGIGVGPAYIARRYGCRVMAVDISDKMLSWAEQRARREEVSDLVAFRQADVCALPFEDDRFDAVLVESVFAFVEDKETAIRELIRVTRPGGYVGLNETYWTEKPSARLLSYSASVGPQVLTEAEWRTVWEATSLQERTIQVRTLGARQEVRDRVQWIGWRSIFPAWGRVIKLLLTRPGARASIRGQLDVPPELFRLLGYALFAGRKPQKSSAAPGD
jgi:ubiquinone/menaquinone biosynthesis C-methylase UbiE